MSLTSIPARSPLELLVNARFATRPISGVNRVAWELVRSLQVLSDELEQVRVNLSFALPARSNILRDQWESTLGEAPPFVRSAYFGGHAWEQLQLPFVRTDAWLLSPCNVGPIMRRRQIVFIHDAQTYLAPKAYSLPFRLWYRSVLPLVARRAQIVITVSEYSRDQLEFFGVVPETKAHVIYNGADHILRVAADPEALPRYRLKPKQYFLCLGSLAQHKNLRVLFEAAEILSTRTQGLVVAGCGNERVFPRVHTGSMPNVRFLGRVTDAELAALYENAIAFAFPSFTEGFGIPPLEAMLCGCPVVASKAGAIPEICGRSVAYADPKRPEEWSQSLLRICDELGFARELIDSGRVLASRFTWRRAAIALLETIAAADRNDRLIESLARLT